MGRYWVPNPHAHLSSDEWLTPPWILQTLGTFDLDPCAATNRPWPTAITHYSIDDDGLSRPWVGRVWCNPPYGKVLEKWITRMSIHGDGIALFPLRSTDTRWFHEAVWEKASGVLFVRGRLRFHTPEGIEGGPCPHSSILVAWGELNNSILRTSSIVGRRISLK